MDNFERASILTEALPYIRAYTGKTIVVKYDAMQSADLQKAVISDIILLSLIGVRVILVHGAEKPETGMDIVGMITDEGGKAFSFTGLDASLFTLKDNVLQINSELVNLALDNGFIPVISSIARGPGNKPSKDIDAVTAAMELAVSLGAQKLILLTGSSGVQNKDGTLISELPISKVRLFIKEGIISSDMVHPVNSCVLAVRKGVPRAHILDDRVPHSILVEMLTDSGIGTMILED